MERIFIVGESVTCVNVVSSGLMHAANTCPPAPGTTTFVLKPTQKITADHPTTNIRGVILVVSLRKECAATVTEQYSHIRATTSADKLILLPIKCGEEGAGVELNELAKSLDQEKIKWEALIKEEIAKIKSSKVLTAAGQERCLLLAKWLANDLTVNICTAIDENALQTDTDIWSAELYHLICNLDPDSTVRLEKEGDENQVLIKVHSSDTIHLPHKPPALHWTPAPCAEEVQITLRLQFISWTPSEQWMNQLADQIQHSQLYNNAEYTYRWNKGLLARYDVFVKVCMSWEDPQVIELSSRVDVDELGDAKRSANEVLWKNLAPYATALILYIEDVLRLPYRISLAPIGNIYYETPLPVECSFDLTQLLSEKEKSSRYAFKPQPNTNAKARNTLFLDRCFPGFRQATFFDLKMWLLQLANTTTSLLEDAANSVTSPMADEDQSMPKVSFDGSALDIPEEGNRSGRRKSLEGRRVSFGHVLVGATVVADANEETDADMVHHLEEYMKKSALENKQ